MKLPFAVFILALVSPASAIDVVRNENFANGHNKNDHSQAYHKFVNTSGEYDVIKTFGKDVGLGHDFDHSHQRHVSTVPEPSNAWLMLAGLGMVGFMVKRQYE